MDPKRKNIAILFFTRSAEAEAQSKRFSEDPHTKRNRQIADTLIAHTRDQIVDSGLPYFTIDEQDQVGDSFGERISNAFQAMYTRGFKQVIVVGNDTPALKTEHLTHAAQQLVSDDTDIVIGPDRDGGTWLMGFDSEAFDADAFRALPWNTPHLFEALLAASDRTGAVSLLEHLTDIDDSFSLQAFARSRGDSLSILRLIKKIKAILTNILAPFYDDKIGSLSELAFHSNLLRAPPLA